ncbi:MAG: hypothetical protein MPJ78_13625 [Hyphomicrobiaceae bacterium]|nr:hypothetical protein [Hyphomicrobiaceae bacterium]
MRRFIVWGAAAALVLSGAGIALYRIVPPLLEAEPSEEEMLGALRASGFDVEGMRFRKVDCTWIKEGVFECSYVLQPRRPPKDFEPSEDKGSFLKLGKSWSVRQTF